MECASLEATTAIIVFRPMSKASTCPGCGARSARMHSRYQRHLADLPIAGHPVRLLVKACRFYCYAVLRGRCIFT